MRFILLNAASESVSIDNLSIPVIMVGQLIVFVGGLLGFYFTLKQRTAMNTQAILTLSDNLNKEIEGNKESIREMKQQHNEAYTKLDGKVTAIEKEVSGIAGGVSEIKGYMKAMAESVKAKHD